MNRKIIGLAGFRKAGKTLISKHLCENHGFKSVHPFGVWKEGLLAMYTAIGINPEEANEMIYGALKDTPSDDLPGRNDSRFLMEKLGKWTGTELGSEWTLGLALKQMSLKYPDTNLIIESIVYEVDVVREFGGHIVMIERPGTEGKGLETDKATRLIQADSHFLNDGSDKNVLRIEFDAHLEHHGLLDECEKMEL